MNYCPKKKTVELNLHCVLKSVNWIRLEIRFNGILWNDDYNVNFPILDINNI